MQRADGVWFRLIDQVLEADVKVRIDIPYSCVHTGSWWSMFVSNTGDNEIDAFTFMASADQTNWAEITMSEISLPIGAGQTLCVSREFPYPHIKIVTSSTFGSKISLWLCHGADYYGYGTPSST